jgi:hypothetical protein
MSADTAGIFTNGGFETMEMLNKICPKGVQLEDYDPFAFVCGIISELLLNWVLQGSHAYQNILATESNN